jgi:hypothetical protein
VSDTRTEYVESNLGSSLSRFNNLQVIDAENAEDLASIIRSIKFQIDIVNIVLKDNRFYAFINSNNPIRVKKRKTK